MRVRRESQERMEPAKKRRMSSPVWEHFDFIPPNKVKCLLCARELGYNNNTSSMLRHYRALHENKGNTDCGARPGEQSPIDEDLVSMVIEDSQPFSIVEDKRFKRSVKSVNPSYVLPT
ncbi:zinc finger BED domain-containing protein 4-like [Oreochromis niloticus]|uniref:zinc finger BED domain-containing protein 4-like n=1 Tax=Oreochromis niloticus TaxID=8128 RepID=UPI000DF2A3D7|nr:zinc finger BED domain-containing protein 4-like [Oreochromis niloticus]